MRGKSKMESKNSETLWVLKHDDEQAPTHDLSQNTKTTMQTYIQKNIFVGILRILRCNKFNWPRRQMLEGSTVQIHLKCTWE
jgi:hypothetical protein